MQQVWKAIGVLTVAAALSVGLSAILTAEPSSEPQQKQAEQTAIPQTPDQAFARAAYYKEKAAAYRREADTHRQMFADYDKKHGSPAAKVLTGQEEASITKMRKHCDDYIKDLERLAAQADRFAEVFQMFGDEMKEK